MTDLNALVTAIANSGADAPVRFRRGQIVSVQADGSATITIAGGTTEVAGVKVAATCCPIPNASCWIASDGRDLFVMSTLAPSGPAFGSMRQSSAQSIPNAAFTDFTWTNRTEVVANGVTAGNTGFTIVVPGIYQVSVCVAFNANATGQRHLQIVKNSSPLFQVSGGNAVTNADVHRLSGSGSAKLAIGDVINATVYQSSGGALNTHINAGFNVLTLTWLGPSA